MLKDLPLTQGSLLELKEELERLNSAREVMEIKRQRLTKKIEALFDKLKPIRNNVRQRMEIVLEDFRIVYSHLGPHLVQAYTGSLKERIKIEIEPHFVVGVKIPFLKLQSLPTISNQFPPLLRKTAKDLRGLIKDFFKMARIEIKISFLSKELKRDNRVANALEERVIPNTKEKIKKIEDKLEQERLEAFKRKKMVRDLIQKRRKQRKAEREQRFKDQS